MTSKVNISTEGGADIDGVSAAVSSRLKALRRERNLTLDALSRLAGVSKGMLVEIEKGAANPSIGTLCKVAAASPVRIIPEKEIPTLWNGPDGGSARLLAGTSGPDMIELWRWVMRPGEVYESQGHPTGTVELFHVEKGVLHLTVGDKKLVMQRGVSAVARTDVPHTYANGGTTELAFTMSVAELHRQRSSI
jgi:transcriptional regulator with XRE-family HTH domain